MLQCNFAVGILSAMRCNAPVAWGRCWHLRHPPARAQYNCLVHICRTSCPPAAELCTYYRGVLALIEHGLAGALHADLLATLVEHLLSLDVDIRWQDIAPSSAGNAPLL